MDIFKVHGGTPLHGEVRVSGAKNATTKLLVASLLSDKKSVFHNVPDIGDVEVTVELCREIGAEIEWDKAAGIIEIQTKELKSSYIPQRFSGSNRIPILMIGALLGRTQEEIIVPTSGGCLIGMRPVDFHIESLRLLGATIEYRNMKQEGAYFAHAHSGLQGAIITLVFPSVGATENTILAAVRAKGTTVIKNAAIEPEIIDVILYLQKLGVNIALDVDRTIRIQGTEKFFDVEHHIISDRMEAASFAMAAVGTKGRVFIKGADHLHMITFLNKIREIGAGFSIKNNGIEFYYDGPLQGGLHIETDVHPGFSTDWQQSFLALLTQAQGSSVVHETVYENRFGYTMMLKEMGADIELIKQCLGGRQCRYAGKNFYHSVIVKGPTPLYGKAISIPDLRAGFAYILAGLMSQEEMIISGVHFVKRGYENLLGKLQNLGGQIEQVAISLKDNDTNQTNKRQQSVAGI